MFTAILVGLPSPLKAVHILWINLLTDTLPCIALGVDPNSSSNVMNKKPRKENESIFAGGTIPHITINAILITLITFLGFLYPAFTYLTSNDLTFTFSNFIASYSVEGILPRAQTYAFTILAMSELFHAIGMRDEHNTIFKFKFFDNKMMLVAIIVGILGQLAVTEIPFLNSAFGTVSLNIKEWLCLIGVASTSLVMHEVLYLISKIKSRKKD
jgi:Ca2+-transporting ATPase